MAKLFIYHLFFFSFFFMNPISKAQKNANILFEVSFSEPQAHYADVKMTIKNIKKDEIIVKMPVWTPGSYMVREFSKNVESFQTSSENEPILSEKIKKNAWKINTKGKNSITIMYRVYCFEVSVRTSYVDASHAFLSSTGIFLCIDGAMADPSIVTIKPYQGWTKVSTGLPKVENEKFTYYAKNFDWLYDSPIEVGNQDIFEFTAAGVKHEVAMVGGGNYNKEQLKADMTKIVEKETRIFGENPNKYYVFIVHNYQSGGGGLEHLNSTVLGASRMAYQDPKSYKDFLSLVAHEYFHLWNVKRLRPIALGPFDYDNENYTTNLWIAEGFTAYYDNLTIQRAGFFSPDDMLNILQSDINAVENQKGNKVQTLSESSFDAWIKYYRPNENSSNTTISYYKKGSLIACMLDLAIINHSNGKQSLDDALKFAYNEFYIQKNRGYTDSEFKNILEKFTGENLDQFYKDYINGFATLDFKKYFGYAGLNWIEKPTTFKKSDLGITLNRENKHEIATVSRGSAAWLSGLNVKDEILAINGERVNDIIDFVSKLSLTDKAVFLINRDGIIRNIEVDLKTSTSKTWQIQPQDKPSVLQKTVLEKWLSL